MKEKKYRKHNKTRQKEIIERNKKLTRFQLVRNMKPKLGDFRTSEIISAILEATKVGSMYYMAP